MDVTVSGCSLLVFSPLLIAVAIWVKLDSPGPVFYRGQRAGRQNRPFGIFKFRSMVMNAERIGGSSTGDHDRRITRSGRFIRKFKIDELSQLINVLVGDMSLVGPRPEVLSYTSKYDGELLEILDVRPGITDWASIWNADEGAVLAGALDADRAFEILIQPTKLKLQLRYVRTRTLWSDIKIIAYTLRKMVDGNFSPRELADIPPLPPGAGAKLALSTAASSNPPHQLPRSLPMTPNRQAREVPFFSYGGAFTEIETPLMNTIQDVVRRGAFILQKDLAEFEQAVAAFLGVKHAFGVGNATDGLVLAFRAVGLQPGEEVIFPSHEMVAGPAAVHYAGGVPVPVDIGADRLLDPAAIEPAITPRTKFIMPVQLNGRTCDMDAIQKVADTHGLRIIEDAAQALGSKFRGRFAGTFGVAAAYSFYPAKILGCLGDGGLVVTDDDAVAEKIELLRDHGRNQEGEVVMWGLNSRLDNLQAAVLHLQFKDYASIVAHRRALAARYHQQLGGLAEVHLPPAPDADPDHFDVYQNFEIEADHRDELKKFLKSRGIGTLLQWGGKAVHQYPKLGMNASLPVTERFFTRCLMLPLNMMVTPDDADYVATAIREFYGS